MRKLYMSLIIISLLGLSACAAKPSPVKPLENFLSAFVAEPSTSQDLTEYFDAEGKYALKLNAFDAGSDNEELVEAMNKIIRDFDYEVIAHTVEKETAVVTLKITSHDIARAYRAWIDGIMTRAMEWVTSGKTEEEILAVELKLLEEALVATPKDKVDTVDVHMVLVDNAWQIADTEENLPLIDVLTGGFLSMLGDIEGPIPNIY